MHIRNTLIMALILVLMSGFVYFYEIRGRAEREEAERIASRLVDFDPETLARITIELPDERLVIDKADTGWTFADPAGIVADSAAIDVMVDELERAEKDRLIAEGPEDLSIFGLDAPDVTVTLSLTDGAERVIAIGKDTPIGANLYVGVDQEVYSSLQSLRPGLALRLLDLRDRSVLEFEEAAVTRVELSGPEIEGGALRQPGADDEWELTSPLSGRADADTVGGLLSDLYTSEAEEFVLDAEPTGEQLAEYGLAEPARVISVWEGDGEPQRLLVGAATEDPAGFYAMREGGSSVFVIAADLVESLPDSGDALRNRAVLALARERVRGLEIDHGALAARMERAGVEWQITRPRTLDADASAVSRILSALQDLRATGFADRARGVDAPDVTVRLEIGDAESDEPAERIELRVGAATQSTNDSDELVTTRFVTTTADDTVYLVQESALDPLRADLFALRDKTIVEFTETDLARFVLTGADGTSYEFDRGDDSWSMAGGAADGFDDSLVSDLLWEFNYLRMTAVAAEWDETAPELSPFGLDAPRFTLRALDEDGEVVALQIGDGAPSAGTDGSDGVWVRTADGAAVYVVAGSLAEAAQALVDALPGE